MTLSEIQRHISLRQLFWPLIKSCANQSNEKNRQAKDTRYELLMHFVLKKLLKKYFYIPT